MPYQMEINEIKDCRHIVNAMEERGFILTLLEAWEIWSKHSIDADAGWLTLIEDKDRLVDEILKAAVQFKIHFQYLS